MSESSKKFSAMQRDLRRGGQSYCSDCDKIKPIEEFYTSKKSNGTIRVYPQCKVCTRIRQNKRGKEIRAARVKEEQEFRERFGW